jgi:hypothetical protein
MGRQLVIIIIGAGFSSLINNLSRIIMLTNASIY